MSLVSGYPQPAFHAGPMPHELYAYHQNRYQEHSEAAYFQSWMLNSQPEMAAVSPESYGFSTPSPTDYAMHGGFQFDDGTAGQLRVTAMRMPPKRKVTANKKERRRTLSINSAFANLRGCIPNVPSDTKLSKIKTLRLATSYIAYLMDVLDKDDPKLTEDGFKADISKKIDRSEEKRKREDIVNGVNTSSEKKSKGRTGWPQHVWAAELKP